MEKPKVILLSGEICSGKSTLTSWLASEFGFKHIKTSDLLRRRAGDSKIPRQELQALGAHLDDAEPEWLVSEFAKLANEELKTDAQKILHAFSDNAPLKVLIDLFKIALPEKELQKIIRDPSLLNSEKVLSDIIGRFNLKLNPKELFTLLQGINNSSEELNHTYIIDSIRIKNQAKLFREVYKHDIIHIHLEAPKEVLQMRYMEREGNPAIEEYLEIKADPTEAQVPALREIADISIDTDRCRDIDVQARVAGVLRLFGQTNKKLVDVIVGGQYGSEGKGNISAYLSPEYSYLVRVGGPNAGHKAKNSIEQEYTFQQLPTGTAVNSNAVLIIGPGATINLDILQEEIADFGIEYTRLLIDPYAVIISKENQDFEKKYLKNKIASTASGSGHAAAMRILDRQLDDNKNLAKNCAALKPYIEKTYDVLENAYRNHEKIFLEGTQGTGLSIFHGHYPHVTSRDTSVAGCLSEAGISPGRVRKTIMVCRTYPIRVGNPENGSGSSGPMAMEVERKELGRRSKLPLRELKELSSVTKKKRRISEFDWDLYRKTVSLNTPTDIALTFVDYLSKKNREAFRYDQLTKETINFIEELERISCAPVSLISTKFEFRSVIDRRDWR